MLKFTKPGGLAPELAQKFQAALDLARRGQDLARHVHALRPSCVGCEGSD
jgi:hypothetical protein